MKTFLTIGISVSTLLLIGAGCFLKAHSGQNGLSGESSKATDTDQVGSFDTYLNDDPSSVVKHFWDSSERYGSGGVNELITAPPSNFSDAEKRCSSQDDKSTLIEPNASPKNDPSTIAVPSPTIGGWMYESIESLSNTVFDEKLEARDISLKSQRGQEAIVSVSYRDKRFTGLVVIYKYFFLAQTGGKWRIFMVVGDPLFHNPSYAGQNCTELD